MRALGLCLLLLLSGCPAPPLRVPSQGYEHPKVPGIRIVADDDVALYHLHGVRWTQNIAARDMREWIVNFLRAARQHGATMIFNIEAHVATLHDGQVLDCYVQLHVARHYISRSEPRPTGYGRTVDSGQKWWFNPTKPTCIRAKSPRNHITASLYGPGLDTGD